MRSGPARSARSGADEVVGVWREIAARHAAVCSALERELGERHGLGVSDFEVLERLAESADHQFRAQELADAVHLSQSALSRLISRLEKSGLVERCLCDLDRRGIYVTLTEAGPPAARRGGPHAPGRAGRRAGLPVGTSPQARMADPPRPCGMSPPPRACTRRPPRGR